MENKNNIQNIVGAKKKPISSCGKEIPSKRAGELEVGNIKSFLPISNSVMKNDLFF
jgi:hypothetical protein